MDHINNMNNDMKTSQRLNSHVADKTDKLTGKSVIMDAQFVPNLLTSLSFLCSRMTVFTPHCRTAQAFPATERRVIKSGLTRILFLGKKRDLN